MARPTAVVIVGGGVAAAALSTSYRETGGQGPVTILAAEATVPYSRPPLSKGVLRGETDPEATHFHPRALYDDRAIELRLGVTVEAVDAEAHEVVVEGERLPYRCLVVATGARPRTLAVPGDADLIGVRTFRTLDDAIAVRDAADDPVLVVGASFIGVEVAGSLRALGRPVTVVEPGDAAMPKLLCPDLSGQIAETLRSDGVRLLLGEEVVELRGHRGRLVGATTSAGRSVDAGLAVLGIGVEPAGEILARAGAEVDDGVLVEATFRTSLPDVYAIGDVARFPEPVSGQVRRIEHWSNAVAHGSHLGRFLAGRREPYDEMPSFFTRTGDLKIEMLGAPRDVDECRLVGSLEEGRVFGVHLRDDAIVGALLSGQSPDVRAEAARLVRARARVGDADVLRPDPRVLRALGGSRLRRGAQPRSR